MRIRARMDVKLLPLATVPLAAPEVLDAALVEVLMAEAVVVEMDSSKVSILCVYVRAKLNAPDTVEESLAPGFCPIVLNSSLSSLSTVSSTTRNCRYMPLLMRCGGAVFCVWCGLGYINFAPAGDAAKNATLLALFNDKWPFKNTISDFITSFTVVLARNLYHPLGLISSTIVKSEGSSLDVSECPKSVTTRSAIASISEDYEDALNIACAVCRSHVKSGERSSVR